jgi:hypothetical protein
VIALVLKRSGTAIDVFGVDGTPLFAMPLLGLSRGTVVALRGPDASEPLPPGHYRVIAWTRGDERHPAQLELADLDLATEARLIDAGSARRGSEERLLDVRGIGAPTGGLGGRRGVAIHAGSAEAVPAGGGLRVAQGDLLRLIDLLEGDPGHGTVVLSVVGEPYFVN